MSDLADKVEKADELTAEKSKPLPYLGWYWRDIKKYTKISEHRGKYWVNVPQKWGYPSATVDEDELEEIVENHLDKIIAQGGQLQEDGAALQKKLEELYDKGDKI